MKKFTLLFFIIAYSHMFIHAQSNILVGTGQAHTTISAALLVANNGDTITLTDAAHYENDIIVSLDVVIQGRGGTQSSIDGCTFGRIFIVPIGKTVLISDLKMENGQSLGGDDGFSSLDPDGKAGENGGAILNMGSLTINNCIFHNNRAGNGGNGYPGEPGLDGGPPGSMMPGGSGENGGMGGSGGSGGAIVNEGTLVINNSTFTNNWGGSGGAGEAGGLGGPGAMGVEDMLPGVFLHGGNGGVGGNGGNGGDGGDGGAIVNLSGIVSITNCTFNNNQGGAPGTPGMGGAGGFGGHGANAPVGSGLTGGNGGIGGSGGSGGNTGTSGSGGAVANISGTVSSVNNTVSGNYTGSYLFIGVGDGGMGGQGGSLGVGDPSMGMPPGTPGQGGDGGSGGNGVRIGLGGGTYNNITLANYLTINSIYANNTSGTAMAYNGGIGGFGGPGGWNFGMGAPAPPGNNGAHGMPGGSQMHEDCSGTYSSEGTNIVLNSNGNSGWITTDFLNIDPQLAPLDFNGGLITTMAIPEGSIANGNGVSAGITLTVPNHDQRLFNRQAAPDGYDIGAYEYRTIPHTLVINEVDARQVTDDYEFIELFDGGIGNTPLDELVVLLFCGIINESYHTISLEGHSTNSNGYFVIGSPGVPNVDLIAFATNNMGNGTNGVALYRGLDWQLGNGTHVIVDSSLIDAMVYLIDTPPSIALQALLNPGEDQINENANFAMDTVSMQRVPNGSGGQRNTSTYVTVPPTPGQENIIPTTLSANPSALNFGDVDVGDNLEIPYLLQGTYLTANVNIAAPPGFEISLTSGSGHGSVLNITPASGIINNTIFVLFSPSAQQAYSGQIDNITLGVSTQSVTVNGNGVVGVAVPGYEEQQILLYPNPFSDFLVVDAVSFSEQIYVEIISSTGQLVTSETFNGKIIISTDHFNAGVYFIKLLINSEIVTHLLIKQ